MECEMRIRWWDWLPFRRWRLIGVVEHADEVPKKLPRAGVVMVSSGGVDKWVAFDCPCRYRHRIMLNIDGARRPRWRVSTESGRILTIMPSVDYSEAHRRCHYVLRHGRVEWSGLAP